MAKRTTVITAAVAAMVIAASSYAFVITTKTNNMTFNRPMALPGVTLGTGTYVFEELSPTSPNVIRILSGDRKRLYLTAFTQTVTRPAGMSTNTTVTLGEATPGTPTPITAWYPLGSSVGHRFIYNETAR